MHQLSIGEGCLLNTAIMDGKSKSNVAGNASSANNTNSSGNKASPVGFVSSARDWLFRPNSGSSSSGKSSYGDMRGMNAWMPTSL